MVFWVRTYIGPESGYEPRHVLTDREGTIYTNLLPENEPRPTLFETVAAAADWAKAGNHTLIVDELLLWSRR